MYQPTTRLLTLLELLQARPRISARELARRLEVDGRTVRRYVSMLQDMGIPVEATRGRYGGYRLRPGYKLPPLMFTEEEALAVTLGLIMARRLGLAATAPAVEGALAKIERVLPPAVGSRTRAAEEAIGFTLASRDAPRVDTGMLLTLSAAAQQRLRVRLRYRDREGAESERDMDVYGLVFHYGRWYVVGLDHRSMEVRTFRLDRVLEAQVGTETFQRPEGFDPVEHLQQALANIPWGFEVEVLLEATLPEARARVPAGVAALEEVEGGVLLRTQVEDLRAAARHIVGMGFSFVVLRPAELRDAVRRLGEELLETAQRGARSGARGEARSGG